MAKVSDVAAQALTTETQFLSGLHNNLEAQRGKLLRGSIWPPTVTDDDSDSLRAIMASKRMYDRDLLKQLPHNRRIVIRGYDRHLLFWKKQTGTAIASVISPFEEMLDGDDNLPPIGLNDLVEHVRKLVGNAKGPHLIGLCSTTGFTEEARNARLDLPNTSVVLVEPSSSGGWKSTALTDDISPEVLKLFDPEDAARKIERVERAVSDHATDLLTGGVSAQRLADKLELPMPLVEQALDQIARKDPELRASGKAGERFLYRGAPVSRQEKTTMSLVDRIKDLFNKDGDEVQKINLLSERRAALTQRRDRLYEDIAKMEEKEADLLRQAKETDSKVSRRRLVPQIAQMRKDLGRQNTTVNMLNQQINIISTDIHNLTLVQQGQMASLPDTQELTENAVRAEEMLETLKADSDLAAGLDTGQGELLASDEEKEIWAELETPEAPAKAAPPAAMEQPAAEQFDAYQEPASDTHQDEKKRESTDPEAT